MPRDITANVKTEVQKKHVMPIILVKVQTTGGDVNVWSGGPGSIDFNGDTYLGAGRLMGISPVKESSDLQNNGVTFSLSGIPSDLISISLSQIQQGLEATAWVGFLDVDTSAIITDPYELFTGITDIPVIDEGGATSTIGIKCENRLVSLKRSRVRRYTNEDQALDDPTDKGLEFVAGLQDFIVTFGPFDNDEANLNIEQQ